MRSTAAVIQARMGSERLPGKILAQLAGRPMLGHVVERTARAQAIDAIVVATSDGPADDAVETFLVGFKQLGGKPVHLVRGPERDVLRRYELAAAVAGADRIVRITGDCPLIDWTTIDALVARFDVTELDYLGAGPPSGFPRGLDCEIFTRAALARADRDATELADREHVTRFFYTYPDLFRCSTLEAPLELRRDYRLCVDEMLDLDLMRAIYDRLWRETPIEIGAVVALLDAEPALAAINRSVAQRAH